MMQILDLRASSGKTQHRHCFPPGRFSKILTLDLHFRISGSPLPEGREIEPRKEKRDITQNGFVFGPKRQNPKVSLTQIHFLDTLYKGMIGNRFSEDRFTEL